MAGSSHVKPGESGSIDVTIDTGSRIAGTVVRTVEVFTNDPERPRVILTLRAGI